VTLLTYHRLLCLFNSLRTIQLLDDFSADKLLHDATKTTEVDEELVEDTEAY